MIETEKKYKLTQELSVKLREFLHEKFQFIKVEDEENTIYNAAVLLRVRKRFGRWLTEYVVTTKGETTIADGIKSREEIELVTRSPNIYKLLESLNYRPRLVYEKAREVFNVPTLVEDVEIALDILPFGYYLEIEGDSAAIVKVEKMLAEGGFTLDTEMYSYPDLTNIYGKSVDGIMEARFSS